jgi:hypothetical protein
MLFSSVWDDLLRAIIWLLVEGHEIVDERPNHIVIIRTTSDYASKSDKSNYENENVTIIPSTELHMPESCRWSHRKIKKSQTTSHKGSNVSIWPKELEQDFEVLCLL